MKKLLTLTFLLAFLSTTTVAGTLTPNKKMKQNKEVKTEIVKKEVQNKPVFKFTGTVTHSKKK